MLNNYLKHLLFFSFLLIPFTSMHGHDALCEGFLPDNNLEVPVDSFKTNGMNQQTFNQVIDSVTRVYAPIVQAKGGTLKSERLWQSSEVNAYAKREGRNWIISIHGGLARHQAITPDGLAVVVCHEVGHHIGGTPIYRGQWASVEGQSDYFATLKCLRRVFEPEADSWNGPVNSSARKKCEAAHGYNTTEAKVCMRIAMAGLSAANMNHALGGNGASPDFDRRDPSVVSATYESHPQSQCRMDTYFSGSLCRVPYSEDVSNSDHLKGVCKNTEMEEYGARARCWYKPTVNTAPIPDPVIPPLDPSPQPTPTPTPDPEPDPNPTPTPTPPDTDIAPAPLMNGQNELHIQNPNQIVTVQIDVRQIQGAIGFYVEMIGPNMEFNQPNGKTPDQRAFIRGSRPLKTFSFQIHPGQHLPGWGVYKIRVIALDRTGQKAVSQFSNSAVLRITP